MREDSKYKLIDTCRSLELAVAALYSAYAKTFPAERDTWIEFAEEELMHAEWLSIIKNYVEDDIISLKLTNISTQSTDRAISFINKHIEKAKEGNVDLRSALIIALQIEESLIEKSFFKLFDFKNTKAEDIKRYISKETIEHRERFQLWLDRVNRREAKAA